MRECLVIYVDAALDKHGRAGCGLAVFVRGRAVYTESFGFSHVGGSAQLEAHVCAGALDLAAARRRGCREEQRQQGEDLRRAPHLACRCGR